MRVLDTRPPFAGLANLSEAALASLPTPCYLLDEAQLRRNGEILLGVQQRTGCKMLLAQKAFSNFDLYPLLAPYLAGKGRKGFHIPSLPLGIDRIKGQGGFSRAGKAG